MGIIIIIIVINIIIVWLNRQKTSISILTKQGDQEIIWLSWLKLNAQKTKKKKNPKKLNE